MAEYLYEDVAGKAALWQKRVDKEQQKPGKQSQPPADSENAQNAYQQTGEVERVWDGTCYRQKLSSKYGEDYGKPPPGSKTEVRGRRAGLLISSEVIEVCYNILRVGGRRPDGIHVVDFGSLFEFYTKVSNKLVGMLLRARRQGLVKFEGEMLYQGRDDRVIIELHKIPKQLEECYIEAYGSVPDHMKMES